MEDRDADQYSRTRLIYGRDAMSKLRQSHIAVFGLGGVGSYVVEALARSGVGALDLIDADTVSPSNLNRQLYALRSTLGQFKTDVAAQRIADIDPDIKVRTYNIFFSAETQEMFDFGTYSCVVDAIDSVRSKVALILASQSAGTPVISSMGAGNKVRPDAFEVADIYSTSVCPLARIMRTELKKYGVRKLKVVYSKEKPLPPAETEPAGKEPAVIGSTAFVPASAGLLIAAEVVRTVTGEDAV